MNRGTNDFPGAPGAPKHVAEFLIEDSSRKSAIRKELLFDA